MYQSKFREWIDVDLPVKEETFLDENNNAFNCYILINKTKEFIVKALRVVKKYIADMETKGKKILMLCMMSGHGFIAQNEQVIVCNEISDNNFYELLPAERLLQTIAAKHSNLYCITLWNCCRSKFE